MRKYYTIPFLALLFLSFCANRKSDSGHTATRASVSLTVERDCLIAGIERRLAALEQDPTTFSFGRVKATVAPSFFRKIDADPASQPIHQK